MFGGEAPGSGRDLGGRDPVGGCPSPPPAPQSRGLRRGKGLGEGVREQPRLRGLGGCSGAPELATRLGSLPSSPLHSYRKLALKNHPLKCKEPWAPERFRRLAEAYDVLSDRKWGDCSLSWS